MRQPARHVLGTIPLVTTALVVAALLVPASGAFAADGDTPTAAPPAHTHQMRAHIDPETGGLTLRPVPLQLSEALQNALSRSDRGLVSVTLPNGTHLLDLQGRFQTLSVVHLGDRGPELLCTHDAATVRALPTVTFQSTAPADR